MKSILTLFMLTILLAGCGGESSESESNRESIVDMQDSTEIEETSIETTDTLIESFIERLEDLTHIPEEIDELEISFDGGETRIYTSVLGELSLWVKYETAITVMDEGPHCDLDDWTHGYTPWLRIEQNERFPLEELGYTQFKFHPYNREEKLPFPITNMDSIRTAVNDKCGDYWSDHIKDCKDPWDYPCGVGYSAIIFRVEGTNKETGKTKFYFIRQPQLMGC